MSSTLSLAALEYLVHVDKEDAPSDLIALEVEIPDDASQELVTLESLPDDWNRVPDHAACIARGDQWLARAEALLLRVPSAVIPIETNVLMNPQHPHAARVRIASSRKFAFDPRLQG
jgi:RES domain-containing protein